MSFFNHLLGSLLGSMFLYYIMTGKPPNSGFIPIKDLVSQVQSSLTYSQKQINNVNALEDYVQKSKNENFEPSLQDEVSKMKQLEYEKVVLNSRLAGAQSEIENLKRACRNHYNY